MNDGKADDHRTRLQIGDEVFVAILDGMSGFAINIQSPLAGQWRRISVNPLPAFTFPSHTLDGKHPAVVTQTGLYENEIFAAYRCTVKTTLALMIVSRKPAAAEAIRSRWLM